MTKFVARRGTLGFAPEVTRGTPVAPTYWMPWAKMSFADQIESASESQGMGNIADQDSFYVTMVMGEGDIDAQIYDNGLGFILESLLGAAPSSSGSNPYTHVFTLSQTNQAKTLSVYWQDPDRNYMFPMCVVESLKITVAPTGMVEYTVHFKSKTARNWATLTPVFTSVGNKFLHQHLVFKLAANIAGLAAASAISLKNLELNINRNTIFDQVMGTSEPEDILSQPISIEGSLTLNLEDDTYRNYMLAGTYRAMEIRLTRVAASSQLTTQFPRVSFMQWEPDYSLNEIAKQKINFKCNYDSANALQIISTATLINGFLSY